MSDPASSPPSLPRVPAARGWHWWLDAFGLLREQPLTLLLFGLVYCLIVLGFNVLPGVGNVLAVLCGVMTAGLIMGAASAGLLGAVANAHPLHSKMLRMKRR